MYFVIDPNGQQYGPADQALLAQWAQEGRLTPSTTIRDARTGQTMVASALPGLFPTPYGAGPYTSSPYAAPSQPYAPYPRGAVGGANSNDVTVAWVLSIVGIVCAFCVCSLIGAGLGIVGVVFARKAASYGDPRAQGPLVTSYIAIGLSAIMLVFNILSLMALRM